MPERILQHGGFTFRIAYDVDTREYSVTRVEREERDMPDIDDLNDPPLFAGLADGIEPIPEAPIGTVNTPYGLWQVNGEAGDAVTTPVSMTTCHRCQLTFHSDHNMTTAMQARMNSANTGITLYRYLQICPTCAEHIVFDICGQCDRIIINPYTSGFEYPEDSPVNMNYGMCLDTAAHGVVCEECAQNYHRCTGCEDTIGSDDGEWVNDEFFCDSCACDARQRHYEEYGIIQDYHSATKTDRFFSLDDDDAARGYFGIELEVENHRGFTDNNTMAEDILTILPDGLPVFERDGSIDGGFEIISKPMTYGYWKGVQDSWHEMLEALSNNGFRSHNGGNCGVHVHMGITSLGKTQSEREATLTKITWVFENYWDDIVKFSRRSSNRINEWACRYGHTEWESLDRIVKNKGDGSGKYSSINMSPMNTIEFRVFRGTLVSGTFDAIIDFLWGLVEGVKRLPMDDVEKCDCLYDFLHPDYLNNNLLAYMEGRDIGGLPIPVSAYGYDGEDDLESDA